MRNHKKALLTREQIQPGDIEVENIPSSVYNGEVVCTQGPSAGGDFLYVSTANICVVGY